MTRKQKIKQLATRELTNTKPFNNHLLQSALVASFFTLTALASFKIGHNDGVKDYHYEMLKAQGTSTPPPVLVWFK